MVITILSERATAGGWIFEASVTGPDDRRQRCRLRLSWADYNLWSPDGSDRPEAVARAALMFLLSKEPAAELAESFDAARIRRRYLDADARIPEMIDPA